MNASSAYSIGIDLGTTNCLLAYSEISSDSCETRILPIPQIVAPNEVESFASLPSFLFLLEPAESESSAFAIPSLPDLAPDIVTGRYAQKSAADQAHRVVATAKSWLSHDAVDRHDSILPWGDLGESDVRKVSPVKASEYLLRHLVAAWNSAFPDAPLINQSVTLTVPACFDVVARELTREAALASGLPENLILLEEPQAATYHWIHQNQQWREEIRQGDSILVCDVGGGTSDLTLMTVDETEGELEIVRKAVGKHLLVGGDNMDLAIAYRVSQKLEEQGTKLNAWQSVSLWHSSRQAKEALLSGSGRESFTISVLGRGRKLIGGTISTELSRDEVSELLVEGFFPVCSMQEKPAPKIASGFQEIGLPYETDTAITKHIADFLSLHCAQTNVPLPQHVLLNGGVFQAAVLRERIAKVINDWNDSDTVPVHILSRPSDLDHSVALGASFYGWSKRNGGVRIRGGTAHSYYIGIESSGLAIPGMPRPLQAVCVLPNGTEEGSSLDIPSSPVGLVVGQPVQFRFFYSDQRQDDQPGSVLKSWDDDELRETSPMEVLLQIDSDEPMNFVPVTFHAEITELGVFELWCQSTQTDQRWKLELNTRDLAATD